MVAGANPEAEAPPKSRIHVAAALGDHDYAKAWIAKIERLEKRRDWRDKSAPFIDPLDTHMRTPLHYAAIEGKYRMANMLLNANADPNIKDAEFEWTPLHHAAFRGRANVVERMLRSDRVRIVARSHDGVTPLMLASGQAWYECADNLIADMDDVDHIDINGWTALHYSAWYGSVDIGVLLLDAGADKELTESTGLTATDIADRAQQEDFMYMIREYGKPGAVDLGYY